MALKKSLTFMYLSPWRYLRYPGGVGSYLFSFCTVKTFFMFVYVHMQLPIFILYCKNIFYINIFIYV
jgi:hypothetical protein